MRNYFKVAFDETLGGTCSAIINPIFSVQYVTHPRLPFKNFLW